MAQVLRQSLNAIETLVKTFGTETPFSIALGKKKPTAFLAHDEVTGEGG